jgi:hypothetical protein
MTRSVRVRPEAERDLYAELYRGLRRVRVRRFPVGVFTPAAAQPNSSITSFKSSSARAIERAIEYVASFTTADREHDYRVVWAEFRRRAALSNGLTL